LERGDFRDPPPEQDRTTSETMPSGVLGHAVRVDVARAERSTELVWAATLAL
jgi:hypothetical protein